MNKVVELFGSATSDRSLDWSSIISQQHCAYTNKPCYKVRKSQSHISIGTCTVLYRKPPEPVIICPTRLLERRQIFTDCLHLLTTHEPGNELHIVPEVTIPGGSVDYFLVSVKDGIIKDFVGIELQTMDTTGTVWPERQRLLKEMDIPRADSEENSRKTFAMNWKMTAKTILVQMHHKVQTFEHVHKKLVLVIQDKLLDYMSNQFRFDHLKKTPALGDSMHLHAYRMGSNNSGGFKLSMATRLSTDAEGIAACLDLQAEARVELELIVTALQSKISDSTLFSPV